VKTLELFIANSMGCLWCGQVGVEAHHVLGEADNLFIEGFGTADLKISLVFHKNLSQDQ